MHLTDEEKRRGLVPEWIPLQEALDLFSKHESYADVNEEKRGSYQREYMALSELLIDRLPEPIREKVSGKSFSLDKTGKSGSTVMLFDDCVLKVMPLGMEDEKTVQMTRWLSGKVSVPEILAFEQDDQKQYLLMSKVRGTMSCDKYYLEHPDEMPGVYKQIEKEDGTEVAVKDLVSGMTDRYALNLYDKLFVPQEWRQL